MHEIYSLGDISKLIKMPRHVLEYAIASGRIPEPRLRFLGKRCFQSDEVDRIIAYFQTQKPNRGKVVQE